MVVARGMWSYCLMRIVLRFGGTGRWLGIVAFLAAELVPDKWLKWLMLSVTITTKC